jgi:tetratricopeptide (TPR) repeat protein
MDPGIEFSLGAVYYWRHDLDRADKAFARLLAVDPNHVGALYHLGKIALQRRAVDEAIVHLSRCVALAPANKGAHYQLAQAYKLKGDSEKADQELAAFRALGAETTAEDEWREGRVERAGTRPGRPSTPR